MAASGSSDVLVFDACAVIALLHGEPGAEVVEALLREQDNRCLIHAINLCEVFYYVARSAGEARADQLETLVRGFGLDVEDSMSSSLWRLAGKLKAHWRRVSLADCFALALVTQTGGALVTSDHHELDKIAEAGICPIRFFR